MTRVIVIGAGIIGLSTAWQLSRRGIRPLVLERFGRGHRQGASHGETRNFNNAYAEDHYLDLLQSAREGWDALGDVEGGPLLRLHGLVTHGSGADVGGESGSLGRIAERLIDRGIAAQMLTGREAARRWHGMRFEDEVLFSPDAGVVRAAAALRELERRVTLAGGEVRWDTPVAAVEHRPTGAGVTLVGGERLEADVIVVTAGAWTEHLLPGIPLPPLRVTEETPAHFAPRDGSVWPSFNHFASEAIAPVYGMPTPGEGVKVGYHAVGDVVDPDARPHRTTHAAALVEYVREWMPGLDPTSAVHISCTYASTPNAAFVLDRVGPLIVGAGFSGHGFKFAPGIGALLAGAALDEKTKAAHPFRLAV
jgi:sarcosine oxidase